MAFRYWALIVFVFARLGMSCVNDGDCGAGEFCGGFNMGCMMGPTCITASTQCPNYVNSGTCLDLRKSNCTTLVCEWTGSACQAIGGGAPFLPTGSELSSSFSGYLLALIFLGVMGFYEWGKRKRIKHV